ncbi:hypothetical protein BDV36DRAFT_242663 [Aspergillus pseudocaelatus]|uniref:beta-glucosidase n=1 Tax=Aspergillus pseudocaelatus TaxID=1825620 RepID=A0ABQ6X2E3_9EURO|nr:hypothetical protein BDV36DRAFT_242663 [Aspergillus pseudocaelatus]
MGSSPEGLNGTVERACDMRGVFLLDITSTIIHTPERQDKILFPFGYGWSYTSFQLHDITLAASGEEDEDWVRVQVYVPNVGSRQGGETVQVYDGWPDHSLDHPWKTFITFQQVAVDPGETKEICPGILSKGLRLL